MSGLWRSYRRPAATEVTPQIPWQLRAGRQVHYYPRTGENQAPKLPGLAVTINKVLAYDAVEVSHGGQNILAVRGGTRGTQRRDPGTFEDLDFRHRRHLRLHLTHAAIFADNLLADSALAALWRSYLVDVDLIVQNPATQMSLCSSTVDKFNTLDIPCNFGFIAMAALHSSEIDGEIVPGDDYGGGLHEYGIPYLSEQGITVYAKGMRSIYLNQAFWQLRADDLNTYWTALKGRVGPWFHCQMECAFISQGGRIQIEVAGGTQATLKTAMSPYLNAIAATGMKTIVRPFGIPEDWTLGLVVSAGASGSVYCTEVDNNQSKRRRQNTRGWRESLGANRATWSALIATMPPDAVAVPLKLESEFRTAGAESLDDPFAETDHLYCVHEVVDLVESGGTVPEFGKTAWKNMTTKTAANAGGTKTPSLNDLVAHWTVPNDASAQIAVTACVGTGRGTDNQASIQPWVRTSNGVSVITDAVSNTRLVGLEGFTTPALTSNQADCWRVGGPDAGDNPITDLANTSVSYESLLLYFKARLPSVAPANGVKWGIAGQVNGNASVWTLIWNGTTGKIELNVRSVAGEQTFDYITSPIPGSVYRFVVSYDRTKNLGGNLGAWWTPAAGWVEPSIVKNTSTTQITLGGTHDLPNRATLVLGIPGLVLPYDSDIGVGKRAPTTTEMTCLNTATWTVTPLVALNSQVYSGKVDGVAWTFTSDSSATLAEILTGIAAAIDAQTTATVTNTGEAVTVVRDGILVVSIDDTRYQSCTLTHNRWPFGYNFA